MRLWSWVVTHDMTLPCRQSRRYGTTAGALLATRSSVEGLALEVGGDRVDLLLRPAVPDGRHRAEPVLEDRLDLRRIRRDGAVGDLGSDEPFRLRAVALGAGRDE